MKVFIDGKEGTTGLRIYERIKSLGDVEVLSLKEEHRKSLTARKEAINKSDVTFLCLPDEAAKQAVSLVENNNCRIIDASCAHRTNPDWVYGFPEISKTHRDKILNSRRISVPGCHASGFIALVYPLIKTGAIADTALLSCFSLTGYSGGGKAMIAQYESNNRDNELCSCRHYATNQEHKHLPEMKYVTGLKNNPVFNPVVGDYYAGMLLSIPMHISALKGIGKVKTLNELYADFYAGEPLITVKPFGGDNSPIYANALAGKDNMELYILGGEERATLYALYDNLGKGASGAALQCMNIVSGIEQTRGLVI